MGLEISDVRVIPVKPQAGGLIGFCSFIVDKALYVSEIAIYNCVNRPEGYRLVYPDKVLRVNGKRVHVVHPITREADDLITAAVVAELKRVIGRMAEREERNFEGIFRDEQEEKR